MEENKITDEKMKKLIGKNIKIIDCYSEQMPFCDYEVLLIEVEGEQKRIVTVSREPSGFQLEDE